MPTQKTMLRNLVIEIDKIDKCGEDELTRRRKEYDAIMATSDALMATPSGEKGRKRKAVPILECADAGAD